MKDYANVPTPHLLLLAIIKLSRGGSGFCVDTTIENITKVLKKNYGRDITRTRVEQILKDLKSRGLILEKRGLLSDKRVHVFSVNPDLISREIFAVVRISGQAVIHNDNYMGTIYDIQSPHSIEHDLLIGLDGTYHKLKIIRNEYFNREPLPTGASSNKVPSFADWRPYSQKLMENLENELWKRSTAPH